MESDWLCVFVFVWCGMTNTNCHTIDHFIIYFCVFVVSLANIFGFIQIQKLRLKFCVSAFHQSFASVFFLPAHLSTTHRIWCGRKRLSTVCMQFT